MTQLSEREVQVLRLVAEGYNNQAIGEVLYLTEDTIKTHMVRLRRKLKAHDRAHAVSRGYQLGILRAGETLAVVDGPPTERWIDVRWEKTRSELLRAYRERRREFSGVPGATQAGARALWRLADLHPQQFRALVADELDRDEQGQDAAA
jgi:DNA-binding CsgD family transcriptional regulator